MTINRIIPRLLLGFLLLSPLPLGVLAWLYTGAFERTLTQTVLINLTSLADKKADQINTYFDERIQDGQMLARSDITIQALTTLAPLHVHQKRGQDAYPAKENWFRDYFHTQLDLGGYYDLLLTDLAGNVVLSVRHEPDYLSNLNTGPFRDSALARAQRESLALLGSRTTQAHPYAPSDNRPAIFIVTPVMKAGKPVGTLALQLNLDRLTSVTTDNTGLGMTGETVLAQSESDTALYVGPLNHIRDAAFRYRVPMPKVAKPMQAALTGDHGSGLTNDYVGVDIVAAWRYLPALRWGMVVKMDTEEALGPARDLHRYIYGALALLLLLSGLVAWLFGRSLVLPIKRLTVVARQIADGDLRQRIEAEGCDEFRALANNFNSMAGQIAEEKASLEQRVEQRTRELRESEERFRSIFEQANVGIALADAEGVLIDFNASFMQLVDYPANQLKGLNFSQITHPDDLAAEIAQVVAIQAGTRDAYRLEKRYQTGTRGSVWADVVVTVLRDESGKIMNYVGVAVDIDARKRSQTEYQAVLNTTLDGFWISDSEGRFLDVNEAYCRMIGYDRISLLAMCIPDIEAQEQPEDTRNHLEKIIREGVDRFETRHRHRDGHIIDIEVSVNLIPQSGNRMAVFLRDITERKHTSHALEQAKQSAEAANRAKSEFLANMSHEIRTPMNAILGLTELVLDTDLDSRQRDFLGKTLASGRALLGILNDILDYSKIEAGRMSVERVETNVEAVLSEVADLFSARIAEKELELFIDLAPDVPSQILSDPLRLTQVLNNLIGNAIKFTERGEIAVRVELAGGDAENLTLRFSVRDTGIGLTRSQVDHLFEPFTQADGSITRRYGGTGLGLAICQKLIRLMGGDIEASGEEGLGAIFTFTIHAGRSPESAETEPKQQLSGMHTLIVDDQETSRRILSHLVEAWGLTAEAVDSGEAALDRIFAAERAGTPFDLILLDWRMPGLSGLDVARRLRMAVEGGELGHPLLVVMVTAHDREDLIAASESLHLDGALTKPVVPSHLFDILAGQCRLEQVRPRKLATLAHYPGARALLVEDSPLNQQVAAELLKKRGLTVSVANHGGEAVELADSEPFDIVFMDLHMPVMNGIEAARQILSRPETRHIPIVAMTAAVFPEDQARCEEAGMVDFIAKPVELERLDAVLAKWLADWRKDEPVPVSADRDQPAVMPDLPGFDTAAGLRRLESNMALYRRLLLEFARTESDAPAELASLLASGQIEPAAERLHRIKGLAANLGAPALADASGRFEAELRAGAEPATQAEFAQRLDQCTQGIRHGISPDLQDADDAVDSESLLTTLRRLVPFLEQHELPPDDLTTRLHELAHRSGAQTPLRRMLGQLDEFNHDGALATVAAIFATHGERLT